MKEYLTVKKAMKTYDKSDSTIRRLLRNMSENDRDKYIVKNGNRNEIDTDYLDLKFRPREAVIRDQSNDIVKLMNVADRMATVTELLTDTNSPFIRAVMEMAETAKKNENLLESTIEQNEQLKKIIDRLVTATPGNQLQEEDKPPKPKKSKKSKKGKKSKKKIKSKKGKSKKTKKSNK